MHFYLANKNGLLCKKFSDGLNSVSLRFRWLQSVYISENFKLNENFTISVIGSDNAKKCYGRVVTINVRVQQIVLMSRQNIILIQ